MSRIAPQSAPRQRRPKNTGFTKAELKRYLNYIGALGSIQVHGCILCRAEAEVAHIKLSEPCPQCDGEGVVSCEWCEPCEGTGFRFAKITNLRQHRWSINLCPAEHRLYKGCQHDGLEAFFWSERGIDILGASKALQDIYDTSPSMPVALESAMALLEDLR